MNAKISPQTVNNQIIDLDLSVTAKKKFRFDKDDNRIIELNISDMGLLGRLSDAYPKLNELQDKASKVTDGIEINEGESEAESMASARIMADRLSEIDKEMREQIDYIFNSPVSVAAAPDGSMYDVFNGDYRYNYILNVLMAQYENNLQSEFKRMEKQMKTHTDKYTKKRK